MNSTANWWNGSANAVWPNSGADNDAIFGGTAGTVTISSVTANDITFNTTGYTLASNTLTLNGTTPTITTDLGISATISSVIAGSSGLTKVGAGTLTLSGANTFTGTTTINGGTLSISGLAGTINASTGITLAGGNLQLVNTTTAEGSVDRVKDIAAITSNGGTITYQNTAGNTYAEMLGPVALTSGQLNVVLGNNMTAGSQTLTFADLTQSNTSTAAFSANGGLNVSGNVIKVTNKGTTATGQIIGPWATVGAAANAQTDYAVYSSDRIAAANITASSENTWATTTTVNAYTLSGAANLTATRNMTALRYTGAGDTLALGAYNLQTCGILNGGSGLLTISGTGAVKQMGTSAAKLYINTGSADIAISAPVKDNTGVLTLVKSGTGTLTLSGANTYAGLTDVQAGTLSLARVGGTIVDTAAVQVSGGRLNVAESDIVGTVTLSRGTISGAGTLTGSSYVLTDTGTISASLGSNSATLTKTGAGTVTLSGSMAYTGATSISGGALRLAQGGSMGATAISVTNTATYGTAYTSSGNDIAGGKSLSLASGTTLDLRDSNTNTLKFPSSSTLDSANLRFDLGTGGASDRLDFRSTLTQRNTNTFQFTALADTLTTGDRAYTLLSGSSFFIERFSTPSTLTIGSRTYNLRLSVASDYSALYLDVTGGAAPTIGAITATPTEATIITGGATGFTFTVANTGNADLNFMGTAGTDVVGATVSGSAAANTTSSSVAGLIFIGQTVGMNQTGTFSVSDLNATPSSKTGTVTVNVLDHASTITSGTLNLGSIHEGYASSITSSAVNVQNGIASDYRVALAGSTTGAIGNISLNDISGIAAGGSQDITATLVVGQGLGKINHNFTYTFKDDSDLPGNNPTLSTSNLTVTGEVYSGKSTWKGGDGVWGKLNESSFGANWGDGQGSPGLDAKFQTGEDTATFDADSGTVSLNGASPALGSITFTASAGSYRLTATGGGQLTLAGSAATIDARGTHEIAAPLKLESNLTATVASAGTLTISGPIAGGGNGITKEGDGKLVLSPASTNAYSGQTVLKAGKLQLGGTTSENDPTTGANAWHPVLNGEGGADIQGGAMVFDYSGAGGSSPKDDIANFLHLSHDAGWNGPTVRIQNTKAATTGLVLGWKDDTVTKQVTVMATYSGDFDLNGVVNLDDLNIWKVNFGIETNATFAQGDFDYNGAINLDDLNAWKATFGLPSLVGATGPSNKQLSAPVPEPSTMALLIGGLAGLLGYVWRNRGVRKWEF